MIRLIFFVGIASVLYAHASSVVGKSIINMTADESYKIWDAVNILDDNFYALEGAKKYAIGSTDVRNAQKIVQSHEELPDIFEKLIKAYRESNLDEFLKEKEKIAIILRPIWRDAQYEEREKRRRMGWFGRIKDDFMQSMNKLYGYFFASKIAAKK